MLLRGPARKCTARLVCCSQRRCPHHSHPLARSARSRWPWHCRAMVRAEARGAASIATGPTRSHRTPRTDGW